MPTLDVISVNIWQILISLCNLALLFFLLRKFLYKPVKKMLDERRAAIDGQYADAAAAEEKALADKTAYEEKLKTAAKEAEDIREKAISEADFRSEKMLAEAREKASGIVMRAEEEARLEKQKAEDDIKREITDVSAEIAEKLLGREINKDDHRDLIDSFIGKIGNGDE